MAADRGVLRPMMYRAIQQGVSFNSFYRSAREHGMAMRRADMLTDWADVRKELSNLNRPRSYTPAQVPEAVELSNINFRYPGSYYYRVRIEYKKPTPEGLKYQVITTVFSEPQTVESILRETSRRFVGGEYESLSDIKGFKFLQALKAPTS